MLFWFKIFCNLLKKAISHFYFIFCCLLLFLDASIINNVLEERTLRSWSNLQPHIRDGLSKYEGIAEITTALPTMWMGLEND